MMRLFVGLSIPDSVAQSLMLVQAGVPGARWQTREQLHLTLAFIGEVEGHVARMVEDALADIRAPGFSLQLHGVGQFGEGKRARSHALWAGVRSNPALDHLQRKVDSAIRRVGLPDDAHRFTPHVTLARMRDPEMGKLVEWLTHHALYTSAEYEVGAFHLYSSRLTSDGSIYRIEQSYDLEIYHDEDGDDEAGD